MIIENISVQGWRCYRHPHVFQFGPGFNLLIGGNGAGKSTLFEVLTRCFFDRHGSVSEPIQAIVPLESELAPQGAVVFAAGDKRFRVSKRFLNKPSCKLEESIRGNWTLVADGDRAEARVRELLGSRQAPTLAAGARDRGISHALWYLQIDPAMPDERLRWCDGVRHGLSGVLNAVTRTQPERQLLMQLKRGFETHYTPTGRERVGGMLAGARITMNSLAAELKPLQEMILDADRYRTELDRSNREWHDAEAVATEKAAALEQFAAGLLEADRLQERRARVEQAVVVAQAAARRLRDDLDAVRRHNAEDAEIEQELRDCRSATARHEAQSAVAREDAERGRRELGEVLQPRAVDLRNEAALLSALERLNKLLQIRAETAQRAGRADLAAAELDAAGAALESVVAPSEAELAAYENASTQLTLAEDRRKHTAIRVAIRLTDRDRAIHATPDASSGAAAGEYLITSETVFHIEGIGSITVGGGGASVEELDDAIGKHRKAAMELLAKYGAGGRQDLYRLREKQAELEFQATAATQRLAELLTVTDPHAGAKRISRGALAAELERQQAGIDEEAERSREVREEWCAWDGRQLRDEIVRRESEIQETDRLITECGRAVAAADARNTESIQTRQQFENRAVEIMARKDVYARENARIISEYGTLSNLELQAEEARTRADCLQLEFDQIAEIFDAKVTVPRRLHAEAQHAHQAAVERRQSAANEIAVKTALIDQLVGTDVYARAADVDAKLEAARRSLQRTVCTAQAIKLLHEVAQDCESRRTAGISAPVTRHLNRWLGDLGDGEFESADVDDSLHLSGVRLTGFSSPLNHASLSFGTQEQLVALLRLSIGVLVSETEPNLVVIDDRLVNSDPQRMQRLCRILEEVAQSCQVVVATCDAAPYAGVPGTRIRVPDDGRNL